MGTIYVGIVMNQTRILKSKIIRGLKIIKNKLKTTTKTIDENNKLIFTVHKFNGWYQTDYNKHLYYQWKKYIILIVDKSYFYKIKPLKIVISLLNSQLNFILSFSSIFIFF